MKSQQRDQERENIKIRDTKRMKQSRNTRKIGERHV